MVATTTFAAAEALLFVAIYRLKISVSRIETSSRAGERFEKTNPISRRAWVRLAKSPQVIQNRLAAPSDGSFRNVKVG